MFYGIITHSFVYGSCQALYDYLLNKNKNVSLIEIPLELSNRIDEILIHNKKNSYKKKIISTRIRFINYFFQLIYSFYYQHKYFKNFDVVISCNPLNCFPSIILKKFFKMKFSIVYFSIDYSSKRFSNFFINYIYQSLDKFCYKNSSFNWDISPTMLNEKLKKYNNKKDIKLIKNKTTVVPVGIWKIYNNKLKLSKKLISFIYIGHFLDRNGIYDIIDYLKDLKNKFNFKITYIGGGDETDNLISYIKKNNLLDNVKIISWVKKEKIYNYIKNSNFAFALYKKTEESYFCNPTIKSNFLLKNLVDSDPISPLLPVMSAIFIFIF